MKKLIPALAFLGTGTIIYRFGNQLSVFFDAKSVILVLGITGTITLSRYNLIQLLKDPGLQLDAIDYVSKISPLVGMLCSILGLVQMLQLLVIPALIGPGLAVCLLSILYGGLISLIATCYRNIQVRPIVTLTVGGGMSICLIAFLCLILALGT